VAAGPSRTSGKGFRTVLSRTIAPGVTYRKLHLSGPDNDVYVVKVSLPRFSSMDVSLGGKLPGSERLADIASSHGAVAAINGDFPVVDDEYRPAHPFAEDGDLKQTADGAWSFAVTAKEDAAYIYRSHEKVRLARGNGNLWGIRHWNDGAPQAGGLAGYTAAAGGLEAPPTDSCAVRLLPTTMRHWTADRDSIRREYTVAEGWNCADSLSRKNGAVVVAARPGTTGAARLQRLTDREPVSLLWSIGPPGIADSIGGKPVLLNDGQVKARDCGGYICNRHPRTGIGITATGKVLMVVVDGRRTNSVGMTLVQFANLFRDLGAVEALNFDGGGSTTMWVEGQVVNVPSQGRQRQVCCAVLALPGRDRGQKIGSAP
jgi:hypothetical protein